MELPIRAMKSLSSHAYGRLVLVRARDRTDGSFLFRMPPKAKSSSQNGEHGKGQPRPQPVVARGDQSASELGMALVSASNDNMIMEICRLLTQGADVNYVHRWMHEEMEKEHNTSDCSSIGWPCGRYQSANQPGSRGEQA